MIPGAFWCLADRTRGRRRPEQNNPAGSPRDAARCILPPFPSDLIYSSVIPVRETPNLRYVAISYWTVMSSLTSYSGEFRTAETCGSRLSATKVLILNVHSTPDTTFYVVYRHLEVVGRDDGSPTVFTGTYYLDFIHRPYVFSHKIRLRNYRFVIWPHGPVRLQEFLDHLNNLRPIQFTMEIECNNTLPFLDVLITRRESSLIATIYKKPTHTGLYLHFQSNHPLHVKQGIVQFIQQGSH
jgi:hypothetical protein